MPTHRLPEYFCYRCDVNISDTENERGDRTRYNGDYYCSNCYDHVQEENDDEDSDEYEQGNYESNGLNSYGFKPETMFYYGTGKVRSHHKQNENSRFEPMMGIELEVELTDNSSISKAIKHVNENNQSGLIYLKEDCSIQHGFEIVTHAMELEYLQNHAMEYANTLEYLRRNGYRSWTTSSCGLHIHISKCSFIDAKHEMKFLYYVYNNRKTLQKFVGRNSSFAKFDIDAFVGSSNNNSEKITILEVVKGVRKNGEYVPSQYERNLAVNRNNHHTHELRIFRPSLRFTTVLAYAEFVHCLFNYAEQVTAGDAMKRNSLKSFAQLIEFAHFKPELYKNFIKRSYERKILEYEQGQK